MDIESSYETFKEGLEEGKMMGSKCGDCGHITAPPRKICPKCGERNLNEFELDGKGKIDVFTVIYVSPPHLKEKAPYPVAIVELNEGPKVMGRLLNVDPENPDQIKAGTEVEFKVLEENEEKIIAFSPVT